MSKYQELIKFVVGINAMLLLGKATVSTQLWLWNQIDNYFNRL